VSPFFARLIEETAPARERFLQIEQLVRGSRGEIPLNSYTAFLGQAYHHVKHTVPLLMACGSRIPPAKEWLRKAVANYIEEEIGHEEWILDDIEACGGDGQAHRQSRPGPEVEIMVAYAYDTVCRVNPVGLFGMVLVLEGTSTLLATNAANAIRETLGLPKAAFSYLSSHGALDVRHMRVFESLMDRIADPADQEAIIHMANMTYRLYGDMFRSLPL
jgi:pyrroloquinoline quinone (PQQ) biosynthesis protein C